MAVVRLKHLDILRGLAALSVCLFHFTNGNKHFLDEGSFLKHMGGYGYLGVEVFFIISGLIIPYSMYASGYELSNFFSFLKKRIVRIEPVYVLSFLIAILLNLASMSLPSYQGMPVDVSGYQIISHLGYFTQIVGLTWLNPVYWTLAIEFQFYLFIGISFSLVKHQNQHVWNVVLFFILSSNLLGSSSSYVFSYAPFFLIGICLFRRLVQIDSFASTSIQLLVISIHLWIDKQDLLLSLLTICAILYILFVKLENELFLWIGKISFSLYLLHVPIGGRVINFSIRLGLNDQEKCIALLLAFTISLLCSAFFYKFCERPFQVLSNKIRYNLKNDSLLQSLISDGSDYKSRKP